MRARVLKTPGVRLLATKVCRYEGGRERFDLLRYRAPGERRISYSLVIWHGRRPFMVTVLHTLAEARAQYDHQGRWPDWLEAPPPLGDWR